LDLYLFGHVKEHDKGLYHGVILKVMKENFKSLDVFLVAASHLSLPMK
jgi:hypothetical protein